MSDLLPVPNDGNPRAPILLIGEAPGKWEHIYGKPFVGPSYTDKLLPWWNDCTPRITRDMVYITNVLDVQPPWIDRVTEHEMRGAFERLHELIATLPGPDGGGPVVIVPTGNYALYALTGKGCVSFHQRDGKWIRPGITSWRGSILQYQDRRGRLMKVIPAIHPAASMPFRTPAYEKPCRADWQRVAGDMAFRELRLMEAEHMIMPSRSEVREYLSWQRGMAAHRAAGAPFDERIAMSLDVETPKHVETEVRQKESTAVTAKCTRCGHTKRWHLHTPTDAVHADGTPVYEATGFCTKKATKKAGGAQCECLVFIAPKGKPRNVKIAEYPYLDCIGYSSDPKLSLTVPTTLKYWQDPAALADILTMLAAFHADPNIDFFGQNFSFDAWWCARERMRIANVRWDLLKMHRVRDPASAWHDLAFQSSLYLRTQYWKDEAKDPDSIQRYAGNREAFYTYNGKDSTHQRALLTAHVEALRANGRWEYYETLEAPMDAGLVDLSLHGIRADMPGRAVEYEKVTTEAKAMSVEINTAAGMPLVGVNKKGTIVGKVASPTKLKVFLYEHLRLPVQYVRNSKKQKVASTNVVTIKRLMERFPGIEALQTVGALVLRHRRLSTIANFVKEAVVSPDGRIYAMFKQDTLLGRLSSKEPPDKLGRNLQNIDRKLRKFYLPDRGDEVQQ